MALVKGIFWSTSLALVASPTVNKALGRATFVFWTWPNTLLPSSHLRVTFFKSDAMCAARAAACSFVSVQTCVWVASRRAVAAAVAWGRAVEAG